MKFLTTALIKAVEAEIASRKQATEDALVKARTDYDAALAEWHASESPKILKDTAQQIARKITRGKVITADDVSVFNGRHSERMTFDRAKPEDDYRVTKVRTSTAALEGLLAILNTVTDEEVTSTGLRDLGYKDLAPLLRSAAQG